MNYRWFTIKNCLFISWVVNEDAFVLKSWVSFHLAEEYHLSHYLLRTLMSHWCFFFPPNFFETSAIFFGSLFDVNLCWTVSTSNNKDLISLLSHNCSRLLRASKCSLLLDVLLSFCDNKAGIVCIAFRIIDRSGAFCVYAFKSLVTYLMYLFPAFPVVNKNNINIFSRRRFSHKLH